MKMDIQIQRTAETLDQGHCAGLCHGFCKARLVRQVRGDGAIDNPQHPGHGFGVAGKQKPQRKRYAKHPLARAARISWSRSPIMIDLVGSSSNFCNAWAIILVLSRRSWSILLPATPSK